ncbi:hypothetical protein SS50377_23788 [Spironucleus salmonicida]|uniref:Uncharacterized protein n=1 Tax=Spironucleus salmonicida TaxID=348837 RepID=V6LRZ9_9EUKA|nr:hypothetical protein SS50377_23788 [Spironucleus salmonicida]|eukprot:EST46466.1 Hypothetical protein SS50377_13548 [Spironucleus salmonicida]
MSKPQPTPEQLVKQAQIGYMPNPLQMRQRQESAMNERLATLDRRDVAQKMDYTQYTQTTQHSTNNNLLEKLLTTHRDNKVQEQTFNQGILEHPQKYRRPFGQFSYEVERNINAGYIKRK